MFKTLYPYNFTAVTAENIYQQKLLESSLQASASIPGALPATSALLPAQALAAEPQAILAAPPSSDDWTPPRPIVRHSVCGPINIDDYLDRIFETEPIETRPDPLFGPLNTIPRFANSLRNNEGWYGQKLLARCLQTIERFKVFEEVTIPISEAAHESVGSDHNHNLQFEQTFDGRKNQRGTYRADIVIYDYDQQNMYVIDCKRKAQRMSPGLSRSQFCQRVKASAMCLKYQFLQEYGIGVTQVRPKIIDLLGNSTPDAMIITVPEIDNFLHVSGVAAEMERAMLRIRAALYARFKRELAFVVEREAEQLNLQVNRIHPHNGQRSDDTQTLLITAEPQESLVAQAAQPAVLIEAAEKAENAEIAGNVTAASVTTNCVTIASATHDNNDHNVKLSETPLNANESAPPPSNFKAPTVFKTPICKSWRIG